MYFDFDLHGQAQAAADYFEIDNLFSLHLRCEAEKCRSYELEHFWSGREDIAFAVGNKAYTGRNAVSRYYCKNDTGRLDVFGGEGAGGDFMSGCSPYIEVAKDGQTAKGVWYVLGVTTDEDEVLRTGRVAADLVKEDGVWKIWHLRRCDDFNWRIPAGYIVEEKPLRTFAEELPAPNGTLDALRAPVRGGVPFEEVCENSAQDAAYAYNYTQALDVMYCHCYGYGAQRFTYELDRWWAQKTPDVAGCHADRGHMGRDLQYTYYAGGNTSMNWGKLEIMHGLFPDEIALDEKNLGVGELVIRCDTSPYMVVADDCKTAQAVWNTIGLSSEIDRQGEPVPFLQIGKEVADIIREDDGWRLRHFRLVGDIDYVLDKRILMDHAASEREYACDGADTVLEPFEMDGYYTPKRVANFAPVPPLAYENWDDALSYVRPADGEK